MAFVNTRDVIGDQATVDGLVEHGLTELKEDGIGKLPQNALYGNKGIQFVDFPNITRIGENAFRECSNLVTVKLGGEGSTNSLYISGGAFVNDKNFTHLVIDMPNVAYLNQNPTLDGTKISLLEGAVYVPANLVNAYKADNAWNKYFITSLDKYPLSVFDSIEDPRSTILSNASYATDYTVKGTKTLELTDGTKIKMDLAAIDTDIKSDNSGTAKMTWICHGIPYTHRMNVTNTAAGGWADSEMRSWLISDILSKIPTEIKSHIVSVKKSYRSKSPNDETLWSDDEIWIPSYKEVGFTFASCIESDGVVYSGLFKSNSNADRIKYNTSGSAIDWWLRSAYYTTGFSCVNSSGGASYYNANAAFGVVFGFCTD